MEKAKTVEALEKIDNTLMGRKVGKLNDILKGIKDLSAKDKALVGKLANEVKTVISEKLEEKKKELNKKTLNDNLEKDFIDVTLPGKKIDQGSLNPISIVQYELEDIFKSMGFMVLDGPELESDYYNFEGLNIPEHHPARDMTDTFYIKSKVKGQKSKVENKQVLRTHTSPVQVRAMLKYGAPMRAVVPGRVFRNEAMDASHEHTFNQLEGLMIDKDISIANIIAVMNKLLTGIFKKDVKTRLRPGFFPFVEPGFELDINCLICGGKGCSVCKQTGWVELLPCGMVHPNVLKAGGINSDEYSGFAFGLGLTRLVMMKYGIDDIRHFASGDLRFLKQFS
ncbi:phenylalanine--tRNA ligase subunit alpha [Candidatus Falkowbacteria bacterium]|nr:phenylalanine--tRNA ligase subunit alpha [Candidatus Falkowbacteria bacterium]